MEQKFREKTEYPNRRNKENLFGILKLKVQEWENPFAKKRRILNLNKAIMEQQAQKSWRGVAVGCENLSHAWSDDGLGLGARIAVKIVFHRRLKIKLLGEESVNIRVLWFPLYGISEREKHRDQTHQEYQTKRGVLHIQLFTEIVRRWEKQKKKEETRKETIQRRIKAGKLVLSLKKIKGCF